MITRDKKSLRVGDVVSQVEPPAKPAIASIIVEQPNGYLYEIPFDYKNPLYDWGRIRKVSKSRASTFYILRREL